MQNPDNASRVEFIHCTFQHQVDHTIVPKGAKRQMRLGRVERTCRVTSHMRQPQRATSGLACFDGSHMSRVPSGQRSHEGTVL